METIHIYTDGACSGNQLENNIGGYGAILVYGRHEKEIVGGEIDTTNNRMEMLALINALRAIKKGNQKIYVYSDSSYLINCFKEKWYLKWQVNNWTTSQKTPVENKELWEDLLYLLSDHEVAFYRVKGHINLASKKTDISKHYEKFLQVNGDSFNLDEFKEIVKMNNRADALANVFIEQERAGNVE
ncbi:MAG: ribonuclease H [Eubacteriales bacterium]